MKRHHLPKIAIFCLLGVVAPRLAWSQPPAVPSDAANTRADELARQGVELIKKHRWAEAEAVCRQALELKRSYDIIGNLGLAEAGQGKWRDAAEHISLALSTFPANGKAAHRELLREKLASAREHIGGLTIDVNTAGAEVLVDGKVVGTAPLTGELFVEPGPHKIEARLSGRGPAQRDVTVAAGGAEKVTLVLVPTKDPPEVTDPPPDRRPRIALAVTSGVLAVGGLAAGIGLTVAANGKGSDADALRATLPNRSACYGAGAALKNCKALNDALGTESALSKGAVAGFVIGGALTAAAVGAGLWATSGGKPGAKERTSLQVLPTISGREAGVLVVGRW